MCLVLINQFQMITPSTEVSKSQMKDKEIQDDCKSFTIIWAT